VGVEKLVLAVFHAEYLLRKLLIVRPTSSPKFAEITVSVPFSTPTGDYTLPLGGVLTEIEILQQLPEPAKSDRSLQASFRLADQSGKIGADLDRLTTRTG